MIRPGWPEILLVLVIVLLLFGPGRIARIASEMGKSIKNFREGMTSDKDQTEDQEKKEDK